MPPHRRVKQELADWLKQHGYTRTAAKSKQPAQSARARKQEHLIELQIIFYGTKTEAARYAQEAANQVDGSVKELHKKPREFPGNRNKHEYVIKVEMRFYGTKTEATRYAQEAAAQVDGDITSFTTPPLM